MAIYLSGRRFQPLWAYPCRGYVGWARAHPGPALATTLPVTADTENQPPEGNNYKTSYH